MSTNDTYPTMVLPLNLEGSIYALQDEKGSTIGTGTREVCELLLHILNKRSFTLTHSEVRARIVREKSTPHVNIRSAIPI